MYFKTRLRNDSITFNYMVAIGKYKFTFTRIKHLGWFNFNFNVAFYPERGLSFLFVFSKLGLSGFLFEPMYEADYDVMEGRL